MLTKKAIDALQNILPNFASGFASFSTRRNTYLNIDKYLQKTGDYTKEGIQSRQAARLGKKDKIGNTEIPICFIYKETAHAFLAGTFLTGSPIFQAVSTREREETASMLSSLTQRDQHRMGWIGELLRTLDDVLRYNLCAAEVAWTAKKSSAVTTHLNTGSNRTGGVEEIVYEGNKVTRWDPYNTFWDESVEPSKVHTDGTYAGHVERLNYIQLKLRYHEWNDLHTVKDNIKKIFSNEKSQQYTKLYYTPVIRQEVPTFAGQNWGHYFGTNPSIPIINGDGIYEVTTMYYKLIPNEYYLQNVEAAGVPRIYKLIWVNGFLAYVEPVNVAHEYLPVIFGQLYPGKPDVKSFTEYLTDIQDLATSMVLAALNSMRRAVDDRALYNPMMVRKNDIDNENNPTAKIPVTMNSYFSDFNQAYQQIPYDDRISGNFMSFMNLAMGLGEQTTGLNKAAQGNFIRGNKTREEFDTIMSNSQARIQLGALNLETTFFGPTKEIIKLNYFVYASNDEITNRDTNSVVKVDVEKLRREAPEYLMADGIMPSTKLMNTEIIIQAIQLMSMDAQLPVEYDLGGMITSILRQQGFNSLNDYKRTPEQQQQTIANLQAIDPRNQQPQQQQQSQQPNQGT